MSGTAVTRTAPGTAIIRTLVPGSVTSSDLAEGLAAEEARADSAYASRPNAAERVLYVSQYGSDSNPGTGPGAAFLTVGAALTALGANPGVIHVGPGTYNYSGSLGRHTGQRIIGAGSQATILNYTGSGTAIGHYSPGTGTRIYGAGLVGFTLETSTGSIGVDLDSTSSSDFRDVVVTGFSAKAWKLDSATSGGCVYNNFYNCMGASTPVGWSVEGAGSNSNNWYGCRASACATTGLDITDCNQNTWYGGTFEVCGTAFKVTANTSGLADGNAIQGARFETNTTNWNITSANVRDTVILLPLEVTGSGTGVDNGSRSQIDAPRSGDKRASIVGSVASWLYSRIVNASAGIPALHVQDTATGGSDAPTVQASTARATSSFFQGERGGSIYFDVSASGVVDLPQGGSYRVAGVPLPTNAISDWTLPSAAVAQTFPRYCATANEPILASGTLFMVGVYLTAGQVINSITFFSATTALGTGTHQWFSLWDSPRNKLAVTSDDTSTAWAAETAKTLTLTAPYTVPSSGFYYFGATVVATTVPSLRGVATGSRITTQVPILSGSSSTGLTDPASAPATAGAISASVALPYAYAS